MPNGARIPPNLCTARKGSKLPWILGGLFGLLVLCGGGVTACVAIVGGAANQVDKQIQQGSTEKRAQITMDNCYADQFVTKADFTVNNTSDRAQSYWVQFEIQDSAGQRIGELHGVLNNVQPGSVAKDTAMGGPSLPAGGKCVLVKVD